jgi:hypothetical protein
MPMAALLLALRALYYFRRHAFRQLSSARFRHHFQYFTLHFSRFSR